MGLVGGGLGHRTGGLVLILGHHLRLDSLRGHPENARALVVSTLAGFPAARRPGDTDDAWVIDPLFHKFGAPQSRDPALVMALEQMMKRAGVDIPPE